MKKLFNITTCEYDLERYSGGEDIRAFTRECGMDGIEVLPIGDNSLGYIPPDLVHGVHLSYFNSWYDLYRGDTASAIDEYGSMEEAMRQLGGPAGDMALRLRAQLDWCQSIGAEYVVYHVANTTLRETATYRFEHTDEQVIEAALEIINAALRGRSYSFRFLVENLWWPGFTFTRPEITRALVEGIDYPRVGIMLDTGHLMHTDMSIDTQEQGLACINRWLNAHGELCRYIRGMHIHAGPSGSFMRSMVADPPTLSGSYFDKLCALYEGVLRTDPHVPFTCAGVQEMVKRISPDFLTYELITADRQQHAQRLIEQGAALGLS